MSQTLHLVKIVHGRLQMTRYYIHYWQQITQFTVSCRDFTILQESETSKTAKILMFMSLQNASKVLTDTSTTLYSILYELTCLTNVRE
jgi:hypothetical protein